jgi:hypothetical protein
LTAIDLDNIEDMTNHLAMKRKYYVELKVDEEVITLFQVTSMITE